MTPYHELLIEVRWFLFSMDHLGDEELIKGLTRMGMTSKFRNHHRKVIRSTEWKQCTNRLLDRFGSHESMNKAISMYRETDLFYGAEKLIP